MDVRVLAETVLSRPPQRGTVRVVAVDGGAGAGKSTLARELAEALRQRGVTTAVVQTDFLLEGWDGQFDFWERLRTQVLEPLVAGRTATYRLYDWQAGRFDGEASVLPADVVIVEGVSAAAACEGFASSTVLLKLDRAERERRWAARDGEALQPEWVAWLDREDAFFASHPVAADMVMVPDDPPAAVRRRASRVVYENPWLRVREDEVAFGDGATGQYGVVERADFALIIAVENDGFWLVEQYRYAIGARDWEFCQGGWPPGHTGTPLALAQAELREELGMTASTWDHLGRLAAAVGYSTQRYDVFLARGLTHGDTDLEVTEQDLVRRWFSDRQVREMVADGRLSDAHSVAALALYDVRHQT